MLAVKRSERERAKTLIMLRKPKADINLKSSRNRPSGAIKTAGPARTCSREESNLHGFPHTVLSRTRLPFRHVSDERTYNAQSACRCATVLTVTADRA